MTISALVELIAAELPSLVRLIQDMRRTRDPGAPPVTDADIIAALQAWAARTTAVDDDWLAQHPPGDVAV